MFQKYLLSLVLLVSATSTALAQSINWATDVAPILYDHCIGCHRDGGLGHFSLIGYDNAFSYREAIQVETEARRMPPWKANPDYRHYTHENRLTDPEIQTIQAWVAGGTLPGDLNQAPAIPVFVEGSSVGVPDHVLLTPLYTVTATEDEYRCFVLPTGLSQPAFLRGLEAIPGNHEAVHHILIYQDVTGQAKILDAATPEPGYVSFGGPNVSGATLVGAWAPGSQVTLMPPTMGVKLEAGADLIVQVHYPKGATGATDKTTLNLFFTPGNQGIREVKLAPILNHTPFSLENGPLSIPANTVKSYHAKFKLPYAASTLAVAPHMHLIGQSMLVFAVTPQNDTIRLIHIPAWDFHWQGSYYFQKVQKIPAQSMLHAYAVYDNTASNPFQPASPPQLVTQGEATTDEMMLVYFAYMGYQPNDEHIVLDSTLLASGISNEPMAGSVTALSVYPNPSSGGTIVGYEVTETIDLRTTLTDVYGRLIRVVSEQRGLVPGFYQEKVAMDGLSPGLYFIRLQAANGGVLMEKLVKQ